MDRLAERTAEEKVSESGTLIRKNRDAEFALIREIYNDSWSGNWGFVPLTEMR